MVNIGINRRPLFVNQRCVPPLTPCRHPWLRTISAVSSSGKAGFHARRLRLMDFSFVGPDDEVLPRHCRSGRTCLASLLKWELGVQASLTQHLMRQQKRLVIGGGSSWGAY